MGIVLGTCAIIPTAQIVAVDSSPVGHKQQEKHRHPGLFKAVEMAPLIETSGCSALTFSVVTAYYIAPRPPPRSPVHDSRRQRGILGDEILKPSQIPTLQQDRGQTQGCEPVLRTQHQRYHSLSAPTCDTVWLLLR